MLAKKLDLTDEQTAQVEEIFRNSQTRAERHEAIEALLTPEQRAKHAEMKATRGAHGKAGCAHAGKAECGHAGKAGCAHAGKAGHGHHGKPGHGKDPATHAAWIQGKLGLSDEQTSQIATAIAGATTREEKHAALETILSPEEFAQLKEMASHRRHGDGESCPCGLKPDQE